MLETMIAALVLLLVAGNVPAAEARPMDATLLRKFDPRTFQGPSGHVLKYRLFKPVAYDARTNYPLVLFLHGAAGSGDDNARQFRGGNEVPPLALIAEPVQAKYPCFVLVPQCPRTDSWASDGAQPTETVRLTLAAIETLRREFSLDPQRLYLIGVSMGGHGVWELAARFPKMFAAAVPICAAGEPAKAARIKELPIWCFHGASDPLVSVDYARAMIASLRKAGGHPRYTEYPGVGHDAYRGAFREPDLLPWLFAQNRRQ